ncbi:unnamed protein product [Rotaria socialis]
MIPLHVLTSDNYEQQWEFETLLHGFREVLHRFARQQEKANDISDEAIHLLKNKSEFLHLQCFLQTVNVILYFLSVFGKDILFVSKEEFQNIDVQKADEDPRIKHIYKAVKKKFHYLDKCEHLNYIYRFFRFNNSKYINTANATFQ